MRLNYCWNFSINHQRLIKKTLARPYKFSKVCARRAASVVGERILLKRDAASGRRDVAAEVKENGGGVVVSVGAVVIGGKGEKKEGRTRMFNVKKKFATVRHRTQKFFRNLPVDKFLFFSIAI